MGRTIRISSGLLCAGILAAAPLQAQTTVAQYAVTVDTTLASTLVATGDGYVPTIAGTNTGTHRDALYVANGATLALASGANVTVRNDNNLTAFLRVGYGDNQTGTLTIASGAALAVGQASHYANFQVAEGQGATGTVQQSGGAVAVIGSFNVGVNGGTGTYTLGGGTLTIDHDDSASTGHTTLAVIGYNGLGASSAASSGTLNITGGTLNVTAHVWDPAGHPGEYGVTRLILGNRTTAGGAGNGTLTQSGGVLHVDNAANLYLSSVGSGTYNLNGGTLEIGGTSLNAKYQTGAGTYAFNLGGGTIKVIGSDLSASANATLTAATTSTFNTNGLNATWSGLLSGNGSLTKAGSGMLTLSNTANSYLGATTVSGGTLNLTGNLLGSAVTVGNGGTLQGSGSAAGVTVESGGFLAPGAGVGTFTVNGDLTLAAGSTTSMEINGFTRGSGYDYLTATGTFYFGGALNVTLGSGLSLAAGNSFDLFDWSAANGSFASFSLPSLGNGLGWDTSQLYTSGVLGVTAAAIPEPAVIGLLAGLAGLGLALARRRYFRG